MLLATSPIIEGEITAPAIFNAEAADDAGNYISVESVTFEPPTAKVELTAEDEAERLFWDKCETLGKIKDCARMIQEVEGEIYGYQDQIKEAKEVMKGQQAGTQTGGIGLALARQLVAAHGGTMEVLSEKGQGTLVRVTLPRG